MNDIGLKMQPLSCKYIERIYEWTPRACFGNTDQCSSRVWEPLWEQRDRKLFSRKFAFNEYFHEIANSLLELLEEFISVLMKTSLVSKLKATTKHKASFVTIIMFVRRGRSAQQTRLQLLSYRTDQLVHCWSPVGSSGTVTCRSHCKCYVFS